jgi:hypothetical protein
MFVLYNLYLYEFVQWDLSSLHVYLPCCKDSVFKENAITTYLTKLKAVPKSRRP